MDKAKILQLVDDYANALVAVQIEQDYFINAKNDQQAARSLDRRIAAQQVVSDLYRQIEEALQ